MAKPRRYLTFANVVSVLALFFSMAGGAIAARHYLIDSTSQINPKVLKKLHGATGEIGPIGPQGVTGPAGPKGATGGRGENYPQVMVAGATENGDFGLQASGAGQISQTITFRVPLSSPIAESQIEFLKPTETSQDCKGPGQAAKGYMCLYSATSTEVDEEKAFNPETGTRPGGTGDQGFTLQAMAASAAGTYEGIYTITDG